MRKWLLGFAAAIAVALTALTLVVLVRFASWRSGVERELLAASTVVATSRGPIEYGAIGEGPAVLVIHGTPGGYDEWLNTIASSGNEWRGFRYIAPSRPGYLRTPLAVGATPAQQADAFAALLDALHVTRAAIIASSGGGPSALQFALRDPERCSALVLEAAVVRKLSGPAAQLPTTALGADYRDLRIYLLHLLADRYGRSPQYAGFIPIAQAELRAEVPYALRRAGTENDMLQEARIPDWPLADIHCPTLILQGTADKNVPLADAEYAHAEIGSSELVTLAGEDHLMSITKHDVLARRIVAFLKEHP